MVVYILYRKKYLLSSRCKKKIINYNFRENLKKMLKYYKLIVLI